ETVSVAVWSDSEAPVKDGEDLPKEQQDLASKRIDALQDYFKSQNQANVKTYNMAERVGLFADLFETDEAVAKKAMTDPTMRAEDEEDRVIEAMARVFKDKGGPSEAVVVVIRDKAELSH